MFKNRFLVPKEISSNCLFCPRSQIITFMIWNQKKKLQIITCEQKQWHVVWVSWHLVPTTKKRKKENTQSLKMPDVGILTYVYTGWAATTNQITGNTYSKKTSCDQKPKTYTIENASLKIREINDITSLRLNNYIKKNMAVVVSLLTDEHHFRTSAKRELGRVWNNELNRCDTTSTDST